MELDRQVPFPVAVPGTGDFVLYSTENDGAFLGSIGGDILGTRRIRAWYRANQASTAKLQVPDGAGGWLTINNSGSGDSVLANALYDVNFLRPAGPHRVVANFSVAPTLWQHPPDVRLQIYP